MENLFTIPSTMLWPLAATLVLTGIHVYLGVHVIARKVIFVDLALAQIAALGTVAGVILGYGISTDTTPLYLYSLSFTIFGAFIFSITRMKAEKIPHEAIIGIVYAVTFAATMLVLSRSALGPQELDHILKGELLWVQGPTVMKTALIYVVVGTFHFIFRKKFMLISFDPAAAEASGINVRLWDFLFYMSFGIVITSAVSIAGVFLVFSYLVIPSVGAMLLSDRLSTRLTIGWVGGAIISFIGVKLSWETGLPTSSLIVVVLAAALMLSALIRYVRDAESKTRAVRMLGLHVLVGAIFIGGVFLFRKAEEDPLEHLMHMLESKVGTDRLTALTNLNDFADDKDIWRDDVVSALHDPNAVVRNAAVELLSRVRDSSAAETIIGLAEDESDMVAKSAIDGLRLLGTQDQGAEMVDVAGRIQDEELRIDLLGVALSFGAREAVRPLIGLSLSDGIFAEDAAEVLRTYVDSPMDPSDALSFEKWWKQNSSLLQWSAVVRKFRLPQVRRGHP